MEHFANYTAEQIKNTNTIELIKCLQFLETYMQHLPVTLANALNSSYIEVLMLGDCANEMSEVKKLMPPLFKKLYGHHEKWYNRRISK